MQNFGTVLISIVCASGITVGGVLWSRSGPEPAPAPGGQGAEIADVQSQLQELTAAVARLEQAGRERPARVETDASREAEIARVVERVLAQRGAPVEASAAKPAADLNVDVVVADLIELGNWSTEGEAIWARVRESGRIDEVIEAFENRTRENPNSPDAHADLGDALVQKIITTSNDVEKGMIAMRADGSYDEALELDDTHWRARFSKAMSYTFYPDFTGKKAEAIDHFEILVGQQQSRASQPGFDQTYLILGNLYEQRGQSDKASEIWRQGLTTHPDSTGLRDRLGDK